MLLGHSLLPGWALSLCAIAGALVITFILLRFTRRHLSTSRLLLAGVALGIICSAAMTWAVYFSTSVDLRQLMYWMMGGFGGVDWQQGWLMLALLPAIIWICLQSGPLNLLALGEVSARQLGLPLWLWRRVLVLIIGWLVGVSWKGIDAGFFWSAMQNAVDWRMDLVNCIIKSVVFAITVTWIALFNGYDAIPTSAGISRATTRTVVHASLAVLALDFVLTALMFGN